MAHSAFGRGLETLLFAGMIWMARKETSVAPEAQLNQAIAGSPQMVEHSLNNMGNIWFVFRIYGRTAIASLNYTWIALFYFGAVC